MRKIILVCIALAGIAVVPDLLYAPVEADTWCNIGHTEVPLKDKLAYFHQENLFEVPWDAQQKQMIRQIARSQSLKEKLRLAQQYMPQVERHLEMAELPLFLKYIPMAESGGHPGKVSPTGAVGLWQMMPRTARKYGLSVNHLVDERFDAERSCQTAMRILHRLDGEFHDWTLSVAAYNCGPTRMRRILRETGATSYSEVAHLLPGQTRHYLRSIVAHAFVYSFGEESELVLSSVS